MDLATEYLGLKLRNPFIVGASPLCDRVATAEELQASGAAAVVMRSLFEEQLEVPEKAFEESVGDSPFAEVAYHLSPQQYLRQLRRLKASLDIPVIASLNGHHSGSWIEFARELEAEGADALELNFYEVVTDTTIAADTIELEILRTVGSIANTVKIPVAVKISPYHTAIAQLAVALEAEGAAGIVLFNRFYQPDFEIETLGVSPVLHLSDPNELLLRLRWLAILSPQLRIPLSATGGIRNWDGAVKALLAGARTVQVVSAVLSEGPPALAHIISGVKNWMHRRSFEDIEEFRGRLDLRATPDPSAFERANYIKTLGSWHSTPPSGRRAG